MNTGNNKIGIILIVIALIVVGYFMFFKEKATAANIPAEATNNNLGVTASGKPITEEMIQKEMRIIKSTPSWFSDVQAGAAQTGIEVHEALRNSAIWMLKNHH